MSKSDLTREELNCKAMLLGLWYDHTDHTFNKNGGNYDHVSIVINPDTMGEWSAETYISQIYLNRRQMVLTEEIGCADGPFNPDPERDPQGYTP